jgi:dethiobiotin synthase
VLSAARVIVVTGTDTDVGKTVAMAAIAASLTTQGATVAVDKPTQTGVGAHDPGDVEEVARLVGAGRVTRSEGIRLTAPMAPVQAAAIEGRALPTLDEHVRRIRDLADRHDHIIVEGAGGLLVQLTGRGDTIADLACAVDSPAHRVAVIVVCRAGLGTLNHTELTLEALARRRLPATGLIIGSWPPDPGAVERANLQHLSHLPTPLLARLPAGAASTFRQLPSSWL